MSEEKALNLFPLCVAFNLLQLNDKGTIALNPAMIESVVADVDGGVYVKMQSKEVYRLNAEESRRLVNETRKAIEMAKSQMERRNSRIALPEMMH